MIMLQFVPLCVTRCVSMLPFVFVFFHIPGVEIIMNFFLVGVEVVRVKSGVSHIWLAEAHFFIIVSAHFQKGLCC